VLAFRRIGPHARGMTLIEIIVVLALAGLLMAVAVPSLRVVMGVDHRRASRELAATLRWVYEEATIRNAAMRVAYDLDRRVYWVEIAEGDALAWKDEKSKDNFDRYMADKAESEARLADRRSGQSQPDLSTLVQSIAGNSEDAGAGLLAGLFTGGGLLPTRGGEFQVNKWQAYEDGGFGHTELPNGVKFAGVWTPIHPDTLRPLDEHEQRAMAEKPQDEQEWRIAYTHAFPGGYMEDAVVYVSDESGEDITSLVVEPLTGRVIVEEGEAQPPDTRDRERE
jgi:prepilin-type N-terminal cleavage/methylation domain-containing protein